MGSPRNAPGRPQVPQLSGNSAQTIAARMALCHVIGFDHVIDCVLDHVVARVIDIEFVPESDNVRVGGIGH